MLQPTIPNRQASQRPSSARSGRLGQGTSQPAGPTYPHGVAVTIAQSTTRVDLDSGRREVLHSGHTVRSPTPPQRAATPRGTSATNTGSLSKDMIAARNSFRNNPALSQSQKDKVGAFLTVSQKETQMLDTRPFHEILKDPFSSCQVDPMTADSLARVKELIRDVDRELGSGPLDGSTSDDLLGSKSGTLRSATVSSLQRSRPVPRASAEVTNNDEHTKQDRLDLTTMLSRREAAKQKAQQEAEQDIHFWDGKAAHEVLGIELEYPKPEGEVLGGCPSGSLDLLSAAPTRPESQSPSDRDDNGDDKDKLPGSGLPSLPHSANDLFEVSAHHATVVVKDEDKAPGGKGRRGTSKGRSASVGIPLESGNTAKPKRILTNPFSAAVETVRHHLLGCKETSEVLLSIAGRLTGLLEQLKLPAQSLLSVECKSITENLDSQVHALLQGLFSCERQLAGLSEEVMKRDDSVSTIEAKMRAAKEQLLSTQLERDAFKQEVWQFRVCTKFRSIVRKRRELDAALAANPITTDSPFARKEGRRASHHHGSLGGTNHGSDGPRRSILGLPSGGAPLATPMTTTPTALDYGDSSRAASGSVGKVEVKTVVQLCLDQYNTLWELYPSVMPDAMETFSDAVQRTLTAFGGNGKLVYRGRGSAWEAVGPAEHPAASRRSTTTLAQGGPSSNSVRQGESFRGHLKSVSHADSPSQGLSDDGPGGSVNLGLIDGGYHLLVFDDPDDALNFSTALQYLTSFLPWPEPIVSARWRGEGPVSSPGFVRNRPVAGSPQRGEEFSLTPTVFYEDCPPPKDDAERLLVEYCEQYRTGGTFDYDGCREIALRMSRLRGRAKDLDALQRTSGLLFRGPRVRVGIHSGVVLLEQPQNTGSTFNSKTIEMHVYGATVMKAAKLCGRARGGETLCSKAAFALVNQSITKTGTFSKLLPLCRLSPTNVHSDDGNGAPALVQESANDFHLFDFGEGVYQILPGRMYRRSILLGPLPENPMLIKLRSTIQYNPNWWIRFNTAPPSYAEMPVPLKVHRPSEDVVDGLTFGKSLTAVPTLHGESVSGGDEDFALGSTARRITAKQRTASLLDRQAHDERQVEQPLLFAPTEAFFDPDDTRLVDVSGVAPFGQRSSYRQTLGKAGELMEDPVAAAETELKMLVHSLPTSEKIILLQGALQHKRRQIDALRLKQALSEEKGEQIRRVEEGRAKLQLEGFDRNPLDDAIGILTTLNVTDLLGFETWVRRPFLKALNAHPTPEPSKSAADPLDKSMTSVGSKGNLASSMRHSEPSSGDGVPTSPSLPTKGERGGWDTSTPNLYALSNPVLRACVQDTNFDWKRVEESSAGMMALDRAKFPSKLISSWIEWKTLHHLQNLDEYLPQLSASSPIDVRWRVAKGLEPELLALKEITRWTKSAGSAVSAVASYAELRMELYNQYCFPRGAPLSSSRGMGDSTSRMEPASSDPSMETPHATRVRSFPLGDVSDFNSYIAQHYPLLSPIHLTSWTTFLKKTGATNAAVQIVGGALLLGYLLSSTSRSVVGESGAGQRRDHAAPASGALSAVSRSPAQAGLGVSASPSGSPLDPYNQGLVHHAPSAALRQISYLLAAPPFAELNQTKGSTGVALPYSPFTASQHYHSRSGTRYSSCHVYLGPLANGSIPLSDLIGEMIATDVKSQVAVLRQALTSGHVNLSQPSQASSSRVDRLMTTAISADDKTNQLLLLAAPMDRDPNATTTGGAGGSNTSGGFLEQSLAPHIHRACNDVASFLQTVRLLAEQLDLLHRNGIPHNAVGPHFVSAKVTEEKLMVPQQHPGAPPAAANSVGSSPATTTSLVHVSINGILCAGVHWSLIHNRLLLSDIDTVAFLTPFVQPSRLRVLSSVARGEKVSAQGGFPGVAFPGSAEWGTTQMEGIAGDVWGLGMTLLFLVCNNAPLAAREFARPQPAMVMGSMVEEQEKFASPQHLGRILQQFGKPWLCKPPTSEALANGVPFLLPLVFDLLHRMLQPNPKDRISLAGVLKHPLLLTLPTEPSTNEPIPNGFVRLVNASQLVVPSAISSGDEQRIKSISVSAGSSMSMSQRQNTSIIGGGESFSTASPGVQSPAPTTGGAPFNFEEVGVVHMDRASGTASGMGIGKAAGERLTSGGFTSSMDTAAPVTTGSSPRNTVARFFSTALSCGPLYQVLYESDGSADDVVVGSGGSSAGASTVAAISGGYHTSELPSITLRSLEHHPTFIQQRRYARDFWQKYQSSLSWTESSPQL